MSDILRDTDIHIGLSLIYFYALFCFVSNRAVRFQLKFSKDWLKGFESCKMHFSIDTCVKYGKSRDGSVNNVAVFEMDGRVSIHEAWKRTHSSMWYWDSECSDYAPLWDTAQAPRNLWIYKLFYLDAELYIQVKDRWNLKTKWAYK
jgi:hypothetical protein